MKKSILITSLVAVIALAAFKFNLFSAAEVGAENEVRNNPITTLTKSEEVELSKLDELDKKLINEINTKLPKADPKLATPEVRLLTAFERMQLSVGKFNSASFISEEMQDLLHDAKMIEIAKQSLVDYEHVEKTFGEQQALVRVFSIRLLDELAKAGEPGPLYEATGQVAHALNAKLVNGETIEKRRDLDLEDLVYASIATYGDKQVIDSPETVMMELGYYDDFHTDIRKIYANQFGAIINRKKSVDETILIVQKLFKKQS
ncbi:hypothetical protein [Pseudoalteromonas sp. DY56-GL79]|uniref:hypothetical protein n=1 Tax=Pseudoalteromonas sp. DY56-GL79 TaxID=2967131 RepID=UPI00352A10F8